MSNVTPSPLPERDDALYLRDMLEFCDRVLQYSAGVDLAGLLVDRMRYDATLRNIELIGVAALKLPDSVRALAPEIAWREIIGTRNRVAHSYLTLDNATLWLVVTESVPHLKGQLLAFLDRWGPPPD
ncbi:MAG: DUF86 domain-containing protein [Rubrivivax sp.]|nr:DUF86 domain-containing protein [Rubrivivax sp.]